MKDFLIGVAQTLVAGIILKLIEMVAELLSEQDR